MSYAGPLKDELLFEGKLSIIQEVSNSYSSYNFNIKKKVHRTDVADAPGLARFFFPLSNNC